jgi:hypothetical protein
MHNGLPVGHCGASQEEEEEEREEEVFESMSDTL